MLAQNFKSPIDLGISVAEHDALAKVLGMLEREEFTDPIEDSGLIATSEFTFHMSATHVENGCGTIACIGGWAAAFMGIEPMGYIRSTTGALQRLFWPAVDSGGFAATRSQAAIALRNYLTYGEPCWREATNGAYT